MDKNTPRLLCPGQNTPEILTPPLAALTKAGLFSFVMIWGHRPENIWQRLPKKELEQLAKATGADHIGLERDPNAENK